MSIKITPPANAARIGRTSDLPPERGEAQFEIVNEGSDRKVVTLDKRQRQVLELLMRGPVFCASPVRLSDTVHILKRETGLRVETTFYPGDRKSGAGAYGVYTLASVVRRLAAREEVV